MSEPKKRYSIDLDTGLFMLAIAMMLIAMMKYGYSCSCMGCHLVDSRPAEVQR